MAMILRAAVVFLAAIGMLAGGSPGLRAAENLVPNPSFENLPASYFWNQNNWAKNDVEFVLDASHPHSGRYSQRVALLHATGEKADLQFMSPVLPVRPGMAVQLRFWTRGLPNTRPLTVSLRKKQFPYATYFQAEINLSKEWGESVFNLSLPLSTDPKDTVLCFDLKEENTYWLDDVSLTELPAQDEGAPLLGNQVRNGSFEVGRDHWYATFRAKSFPDDVNRAEEANAGAGIAAVPEPGAPDGRRVLAFEVFPGCRVLLTSAYFGLRYGHLVTLGFWLKASSAGQAFRIGIGQGKFPNQAIDSEGFTAPDAAWHFYRRRVTPRVSTSGTYYIELAADQPGRYELDGVSVVEGEASEATLPAGPVGRIDIGWGLARDTPPGNLFRPGDPAHFPLLVAGAPGAASLPVRLRLVDYQDREMRRWEISVPLDAQGRGEADVVLPSDRMGGFKVEAFAGRNDFPGVPDADLLYSVVPRLKPPGEAADSFFGAHVALTPYNLAIAERLGFRWLRLHPPLNTKWMVVEREKGRFDFDTRGPDRARAMGFRLVALFDTAPWFHADGDPEQTRASAWYTSYPPGDWGAWRTYVQKTAAAFAPSVSAWEIWNEPDGGFLRVRPGQDKVATYLQIVRQARRALDEVGMHPFLIGNAAATLDRPFTWQELDQGGGGSVDALSFHLYNEDRGPEEKQPPLAGQLEKLRSYPNRSGAVPELWVTESGIWLDSGRSWLDSAGIPASVGTTVADAASLVARSLAGLKAMGVRRFFYYAAFAAPSGRTVYRDECSGLIDVSGVPNPAGAAYAASVYFLEEARPLGLETRPAGTGRVTVASFADDKGPVTVIWSRGGVALGDIPGLDWKNASGFDLMGNPLSLSAATPVTLAPVYLVGSAAIPVDDRRLPWAPQSP